MIYICKGCTLPCKACEVSCKACSQSLNECCDGISNFLGPITQNPLGGYVIGTWVCMVLVIAAMASTLSKVACDEPKYVAYADIGLAVIHSAFAFYIQRRLVSHMDGDASQMTHSEIAAKSRHVMAYDVGFCLYFFVFAGSFVYNCTVFDAFSECSGTGPAWAGAGLLLLYGLGVWNYACCWYACQCCCGKVETKMPHSAADATRVIMGAPAPKSQQQA